MFSSTFPPRSPFPPSRSPSLPPSLPPSFPSPYLPQSPRWSGPRRSSRRRQRCGCCACTNSPDSSTWRCSAVGEERRKGAKEGEGRSVSKRHQERKWRRAKANQTSKQKTSCTPPTFNPLFHSSLLPSFLPFPRPSLLLVVVFLVSPPSSLPWGRRGTANT